MALNNVCIMGNLCNDPTLRHTQSGTPVATFTLAVERDFKNKETGERITDFIPCVSWGSTGEFTSRFFSKGRRAIVSGRLQIREWTDKDGNKRTTAEVVADNVYFGDSRRDGEGRTERPAPNSATPAPGEFAELDDDTSGDLPF